MIDDNPNGADSDDEAREPVVEGDELDELHDSIFGPTNLGAGKRYERLVALIFVTLGERVVRFNVRAPGPGKKAVHQIDVWLDRDEGEQHVIVECKHWSGSVGKGELDTLVGVRTQLEAQGAIVVTTVGYTQGARDVALDEGVDLMIARHFRDPEDWEGRIKEIHLRGTYRYSSVEDVVFRAADPAERDSLDDEDREFGPVPSDDRFVDSEGRPKESIGEVIDSVPQATELGKHPRSVTLAPDRFLLLPSGRRLRVRALDWTEVVEEFSDEHRIGPRSDAQALVLEVDPETGEETDRRAIFDHELRRLSLDEDGNVRRIGP